MKNFLLFFSCICFLAVLVHSSSPQQLLQRMVRAAAPSPPPKKSDCRYEKGTWSECELASGIQKRVFKLRPGQTPSAECEAERIQTRTCKKACRYSKGLWTDCINGAKSRKDQLKGPAPGCEVERTITRKCKSVCKYSKAEWGPCDGQTKTKVLTLVEGTPSECEATKKITKMCHPGSNTTRAGRAKNRSSTRPSS